MFFNDIPALAIQGLKLNVRLFQRYEASKTMGGFRERVCFSSDFIFLVMHGEGHFHRKAFETHAPYSSV